MLYNFQRKKLYRNLLLGGAFCAAGLGMFSCSDSYDLDEKQPSGLNNIYGYMEQQGNYTNYLHLIDDLGLKDILSKTGSKTMFIADDDAFRDFYASNSWGVSNYGELSLAQKKLLLNSSMIDNPYSASMLSSAESLGSSGKPVKGEVCRRSSSQSLLDSVNLIPSAEVGLMPDNPLFNEIRGVRDTIILFNDASTAAPMIHFTGRFVTSNKMDAKDIDFIYNQPKGTFKSDDVYVNNAKVVEPNIFCKNGFVHKVDKVITPLDNMAEVIRKNPKTQIYSSLLERFAAPKDSTSLGRTYFQAQGTEVKDSVFVKRYFSKRSDGSTMTNSKPFTADIHGRPFDGGSALLNYDPGWNGYVPLINNPRVPLMEDMAVMIVPSDEAIREWWDNGGGKVIKDYYETLEKTPNSVLDDLINVNQLVSLTTSVPSKFNAVLNDANEPMGITEADVDEVRLGCNGLVYVTNKVFAPTSYSSVLFPAVIDTTSFRIINNAIENLDYAAYLNSMVSNYTFLLPTNKGMLTYIDPVSYGQTTTNLWEFYLDLTKQAKEQLCANVYEYTKDDEGNWTKGALKTTIKGGTGSGGTSPGGNSNIRNRIVDILDNIIVTERFRADKKYYETKGHTFVRVEKSGDTYQVYGSLQDELQQPLTCVEDETYNMENGISLPLNGVPMSTGRSVIKTLQQAVDEGKPFNEFLSILKVCAASTSNAKDGWQAGDQEYGNLFKLKTPGSVGAEDTQNKNGKGVYLLNNFHYTLYAPTDDAMYEAYDAGLPTLDDLAEAELLDEEEEMGESDPESHAAKILEVMLDFVKYHIQDNSVYVDNGFKSQAYESGKTELIKATEVNEETGEPSWDGTYSPGRPYKLDVKVSATGMSVTDCRNGYDRNTRAFLGGNTAHVIMEEGMYNLMAREYWYKAGSKVTTPWTVNIDNSSAVVIHGIDAPLIYSDGKHYDSNGMEAPTQFEYTYKKLHQ